MQSQSADEYYYTDAVFALIPIFLILFSKLNSWNYMKPCNYHNYELQDL